MFFRKGRAPMVAFLRLNNPLPFGIAIRAVNKSLEARKAL